MITYIQGNLFDSPAQVLTNTVNCFGVMGAGVALEFKKRFPTMFDDYVARCGRRAVIAGRPYLWENDRAQILNFPTKRHWKEGSRLADIDAGLAYLAAHYCEMGIVSLAMPPLGCGLGGLAWDEVKPLIEKHLGDIPDLEVYVYEARPCATVADDNDPKTSPRTKVAGHVAAASVVEDQVQ